MLEVEFLLRLFACVLWIGALITYFAYVFDAPSKEIRSDRLIQNLPMITMMAHVILFYFVVLAGDLTQSEANHTTWSTVIRVHGGLALILHKWLRIRIARAKQDC